MSDHDAPTPMTQPRLSERLRFHGYQVSEHGGQVRGTWEGHSFRLQLGGSEAALRLSVAAQTDRTWSASRYAEVVGACVVVGEQHFLPKVYPLLEGESWRINVEVVSDVAQGLSDQQLDDTLGFAISTCLAALESTEQILS